MLLFVSKFLTFKEFLYLRTEEIQHMKRLLRPVSHYIYVNYSKLYFQTRVSNKHIDIKYFITINSIQLQTDYLKKKYRYIRIIFIALEIFARNDLT
jgi:hypothetical protein